MLFFLHILRWMLLLLVRGRNLAMYIDWWNGIRSSTSYSSNMSKEGEKNLKQFNILAEKLMGIKGDQQVSAKRQAGRPTSQAFRATPREYKHVSSTRRLMYRSATGPRYCADTAWTYFRVCCVGAWWHFNGFKNFRHNINIPIFKKVSLKINFKVIINPIKLKFILILRKY